jgi:hypothetical protein
MVYGFRKVGALLYSFAMQKDGSAGILSRRIGWDTLSGREADSFLMCIFFGEF